MSEIHVGGMPHAWAVLKKMQDLAEWKDYPFGGISAWMDAKDLCWLIECMKHMDDDIFTGGKWATIQNLQALVEREASRAVRTTPPARRNES